MRKVVRAMVWVGIVAAGAAVGVAAGTLMFRHAMARHSPAPISPDTELRGVWSSIGSDDPANEFVLLAVREAFGVTDPQRIVRPTEPSDQSQPKIRAAADTAYVAASSVLGCSADWNPDTAAMAEWRLGPMGTSEQAPSVQVPEGTDGLSGGLVFALIHAADVLGPPPLRVAASGGVDAYGAVIPVGGITQKTMAALDADVDIILFHPNNIDDAAAVAGDKAVPVRTVADAIRVVWGDISDLPQRPC